MPEYAASLAALPGQDPAAQLISQARRAQDESVALARSLFSRWLERVAGLASGRHRREPSMTTRTVCSSRSLAPRTLPPSSRVRWM